MDAKVGQVVRYIHTGKPHNLEYNGLKVGSLVKVVEFAGNQYKLRPLLKSEDRGIIVFAASLLFKTYDDKWWEPL